IADATRARPLFIADPGSSRISSRVYLAARLREGANDTFLYPAYDVGIMPDGTRAVYFEDKTIHLPGTSGAPVLTESGDLLGMVVRFRQRHPKVGGFIASLLPGTAILSLVVGAASW